MSAKKEQAVGAGKVTGAPAAPAPTSSGTNPFEGLSAPANTGRPASTDKSAPVEPPKSADKPADKPAPVETPKSTDKPAPAAKPASAGAGAQTGGDPQASSSSAAPSSGGDESGERKEGDDKDKGKDESQNRDAYCAFTCARRVCAYPALRGAAALAQRTYDAVKRSSRIAEVALAAAETGLKLAAGPAVICSVPICVAMAVPMCVADFGLNCTLNAVEYVAPCVKYDYNEAKEAAAHLGLRVITLPETAAEAVAVLLDTCPGKAIVKAMKLTSDAAGKTCDVLVFCPKDCESTMKDTVFLIPRVSCNMARRLIEAAENGRKAVRDRLAAVGNNRPSEAAEASEESLNDGLEKPSEQRKS